MGDLLAPAPPRVGVRRDQDDEVVGVAHDPPVRFAFAGTCAALIPSRRSVAGHPAAPSMCRRPTPRRHGQPGQRCNDGRTRRCVSGRWQTLISTSPRTVVTAPLTSHPTSSSSVRHACGQWLLLAGLAAVFCAALAARLIPLLRGGGLHAMGNYDD